MFCASTEVQERILSCHGHSQGAIEVADILKWSMTETCMLACRVIPLWETQGIRALRRNTIQRAIATSKFTVNDLLEPESQTVEHCYGPENAKNLGSISGDIEDEELKARYEQQLAQIQEKVCKFKLASCGAASFQEEEERELSPETQREQQIERPQGQSTCRHSLHQDVISLANHGCVDFGSSAFISAFGSLCDTTAWHTYESVWPTNLLVTADFARTVVTTKISADLDFFLRPVNWIISTTQGGKTILVIISPYEAQSLLPSVREHDKVVLHTYYARTNGATPIIENLSFCAIPPVPAFWTTPLISRQLNIFAGQLHLSSYKEYESLCAYLGLCSKPSTLGMQVARDGFLFSMTRNNLGHRKSHAFTRSTIPFLKALMAMRMKCRDISSTHMGKVLDGELLSEESFSESQSFPSKSDS